MTTSAPTTRSWLRSFSNLAIGEGVTGAARFAALIVCARALGVANFGFLNVGLVVGGYLIVAHAGLEVVGTRDVAVRPRDARSLAGGLVGLRLAIAGGLYALTVAVTLVAPLEGITRDLILLFGLTLFTSALDIRWLFIGLERTVPVAVAASVAAVAYLGGIVALVRRPGDVLWVPVIQVVSEALMAVMLLWASRRRIGAWWPAFGGEGRRWWRPAFLESLPIASSKAARGLTLAFDVILIGLLRPPADVGEYGAARRLTMVVLVFLGLYTNAFLPLITRAAERGAARAGQVLNVAVRRTALILVPGAVLGTVAAPLFLRYLVGEEYTGAANALRLLVWSMVAVCIAGLYGQVMVSYHQQKRLLVIDVGSAVVNIALNVVLVPLLGLIGAAVAALAARCVTLVWTVAAARSYLAGEPPPEEVAGEPAAEDLIAPPGAVRPIE